MADAGASKRLKQAQLPFTVKNTPNYGQQHIKCAQAKVEKPSFSEDEDKENISKSGRPLPLVDVAEKQLKSDAEILMIDLTDEKSQGAASEYPTVMGQSSTPEIRLTASTSKMSEDLNRSIDEAIAEVVRRASAECENAEDSILTPKATTAKKRHRSKSISPNISTAKRPVLSVVDLTDEERRVETCQTPSRSAIPTITITAPTPAEKAKRTSGQKGVLAAFFESSKNVEGKVPVKSESEHTSSSEHGSKDGKAPQNTNIGSLTKTKHNAEHGSAKKRRRSGSFSILANVKKDGTTPTTSACPEQASAVTPSKKLKQYRSNDAITPIQNRKTIEQVIDLSSPDKAVSSSVKETGDVSPLASKEDSTVISSDENDEDLEEQFQSPPPSSKPVGPDQTPSPSGSAVTPTSLTKSGNRKPRTPNPEVLRKREEKEKEREKKKKQREEQRLAREKERLELKRKKDEEKAQKEEEKKKKREEEELLKAEKLKKLEEKQKEKEQRELEKKMEKDRKEEERRRERERKEEEKKQKDLEKQRIEGEKLQAEKEKKRKSEKRAETFKSFFKSLAGSPAIKKKTVEKIGFFAPFQLKANMSLAPTQRAMLDSSKKSQLDEKLDKQDGCSGSYLKEQYFKSRGRFSYPTVPKFKGRLVSLSEDGLEVVDDGDSKPGAKLLRAKFLAFHANYRPPYYGTWRKRSKQISPRNPFKQDKELLDYEFDSDDEWEEPAEGEDIANSDGEDEGDGNEEDEDDGFFVPHGYLSDDEGINEEAEDGEKPDHKLKQKQLEFEASFKRKLSALTPVIIGCVWKDSAESLSAAHRQILDSYKVEILSDVPIEIYPSKNAEENNNGVGEASKSDGTKKAKGLKAVPEEAMHDLIRLLHGNALSLARIGNEFREYWRIKQASNGEPLTCGPVSLEGCPLDQEMDMVETPDAAAPLLGTESPAPGRASPVDSAQSSPASALNTGNSEHTISKTQLLKRCKEIATYCKKDNINRSCWFVHDSVLETYDLGKGKAPVPCKWKFVTEVPKIQILIFPQSLAKADPAAEAPKTNAVPSPATGVNIHKFVSKVSASDILQKSYLKHEQEKQHTPDASPMPTLSISKYTTDKLSPRVLIEKSAQRIAEEQAAKVKQVEEKMAVEGNDQTAPREGVYVIPTPAAIRTLFRMEESAATPQGDPSAISGDVEMNDVNVNVEGHWEASEIG